MQLTSNSELSVTLSADGTSFISHDDEEMDDQLQSELAEVIVGLRGPHIPKTTIPEQNLPLFSHIAQTTENESLRKKRKFNDITSIMRPEFLEHISSLESQIETKNMRIQELEKKLASLRNLLS